MNSGYILTILFMTLIVILIIGSFIELSNPKFVSEEMKQLFIKANGSFLAFFLCFIALMFFLNFIKHREGFEAEDVFEKTKTIIQENRMEEICSIYNELYEKIFKVEKGIPPNTFTDEQAREKTLKTMKDVMPRGPISCAKVSKLTEAKDVDSLFTLIQELPNTFLIQSYETAKGCRELLIKNYNDVKASIANIKEGFVDTSVGICSPEITEERRKFLRDKKLSEAAESCLLPEEVPLDKKDSYILDKLNKMTAEFDEYKPSKESLDKILEDCAYYKKELEKIKKEAESGTLVQSSS